MATPDVPGYTAPAKPATPTSPAIPEIMAADELHTGCWAEHDDESSLILVEDVTDEKVIYTIFDVNKKIEYRDSMHPDLFKRSYTFRSGEAVANELWTWHDKTKFPFERIMENKKFALTIEDKITAAIRVAEALKLESTQLRADRRRFSSVMGMIDKLQSALSRLRGI